jgi:hypothetical protein
MLRMIAGPCLMVSKLTEFGRRVQPGGGCVSHR